MKLMSNHFLPVLLGIVCIATNPQLSRADAADALTPAKPINVHKPIIDHAQIFEGQFNDATSVTFASDDRIFLTFNEPNRWVPGNHFQDGDAKQKVQAYGTSTLAQLILTDEELKTELSRFDNTLLTCVRTNDKGIYLAGYGLGSIQTFRDNEKDESKTLLSIPRNETTPHKAPPVPQVHWTDNRYDEVNDVRGRPVVFKLDSKTLKPESVRSFSDGVQTVWHVPQPLIEDVIQPTQIDVLPDGRVVVVYDGGYHREPEAGEKPGPLHYYGLPDHLTLLDADLKEQLWSTQVFSPRIERTDMIKKWRGFDWHMETLGQTRTLRMRVNPKDGNIYLAGWSPTETSGEPWWSPFLFRYDDKGKRIWAAYNPDPMSGPKGRMNNLVSDSALRSVNFDHEGNVLFTSMGDGGNSVLKQDPRDYNKSVGNSRLRGSTWGFSGRTLFWGTAGRLDAKTRELLAGDQLCGFSRPSEGKPRLTPAWAVDIAELEDGRIIVVGRQTRNSRLIARAKNGQPATGFSTSSDADFREGLGGFVRIYSADFRQLHSTILPGVTPREIAVKGNRFVIVGQADQYLPEQLGGQAEDNKAEKKDEDRAWVMIGHLPELAE